MNIQNLEVVELSSDELTAVDGGNVAVVVAVGVVIGAYLVYSAYTALSE